MSNCKTVGSPILPSMKLAACDSTIIKDHTLYRSVVGSLQYLLITCPNLAFFVNVYVNLYILHASHTSKFEAYFMLSQTHFGVWIDHYSFTFLYFGCLFGC